MNREEYESDGERQERSRYSKQPQRPTYQPPQDLAGVFARGRARPAGSSLRRFQAAFEGRFFTRQKEWTATVCLLWHAYEPISRRDNDSWQTTSGRARSVFDRYNVVSEDNVKSAVRQIESGSAAELVTSFGHDLDTVSPEHEERKAQSFAFFQPLNEGQVALADRMVRALPEESEPDPNSNGAG